MLWLLLLNSFPIFRMKDAIIFSKWLICFQQEDSGRKIVEFGYENSVGWGNYVDNWEVGSGWNCLNLSCHGCFGSIRNLDDFSSRNCMFECRDYCGALSSRIHLFGQYLLIMKHMTLQIYSSWHDSRCSPKLKFGMSWLGLLEPALLFLKLLVFSLG